MVARGARRHNETAALVIRESAVDKSCILDSLLQPTLVLVGLDIEACIGTLSVQGTCVVRVIEPAISPGDVFTGDDGSTVPRAVICCAAFNDKPFRSRTVLRGNVYRGARRAIHVDVTDMDTLQRAGPVAGEDRNIHEGSGQKVLLAADHNQTIALDHDIGSMLFVLIADDKL